MKGDLSRKSVERLLDAEKSLSRLSSVDETLKVIMQEAVRLAEAEGGSLLLYDPQKDHLVFYVVVGEHEKRLRGRTVQMGEGIAGHVAKTRKIELVKSAYHDSRFAERFDTFLDHHTRSLIAAPILNQNKLLGVLELVNHRGKPSFPIETLQMIQEFSERASSALSSAMELQEARFDADRWRALYEISSRENMTHSPLDRIIGSSAIVQRIKTEVRQVAVTPSTVMIRGETGTGKELVALAIHELSSRREQPFVKVNCGALPANLIESELFGHEKGAFTGANEKRMGRFELAAGGTIFLDEIGDLGLDLQVKLLRVLQNQEFERVGGSETLKIDVRVIAATHWNLEAAIAEKRFRPDLYYRLNIFPIYMPPLRERKDDIPLLAHYFLQKHNPRLHHSVKGFSETVYEYFLNYDWPGNIRELETVVERAIISCHGNVIESVDLPSQAVMVEKSRKGILLHPVLNITEEKLPATLSLGVLDYKKRMVQLALNLSGGNQREAAGRLGMAASNFSRLVHQLKIRVSSLD